MPDDVQNNENSTPEKKLGGVTGKGFMPGQSGNPGGRPKRPWLTEATEEMLAEKLEDPKERKRWKDAQWEKMLKSGVVGAMFMDVAWERTEGKVTQPVDVNVNITLRERMKKAEERSKNHNR